jgi:hypothetical protein
MEVIPFYLKSAEEEFKRRDAVCAEKKRGRKERKSHHPL